MMSKMPFSFGQLTSNNNGKTSSSASMGIYIVLIGGICFLLGCVDKMWIHGDIDIITQSIVFTGIGGALLTVKRIKNN